MTRFLCQELLYEYVSGFLDSRRQDDIREHLADCKESQRELDKLKRGLAYSQRAAQLEVSMRLHQALLDFEPHWQKQLREWTMWSSQRGWKMLPYIFIVATIVTGLIVTKPWKARESNDVILAQQLQNEPEMLGPAHEAIAANPQPEAAPPPAKPVVNSAVVVAPVVPTPTPVVPSAPPPVKVTPAVAKAEEASNQKTEAPASARGFIMRGEIDVTDFTNSWPAIRDKIVSLDGKVAGNVELGWLRRPDQSYFHFSLPESNFSELELFLGTFGPVRFSKERNPRVMPEGQIRIILTVKDAVTHEGSAETP